MKTIVLVMLIVLATSCTSRNYDSRSTVREQVVKEKLMIETINDCDFVFSRFSDRGGIIHHPACKNTDHNED